MQWFPYGEPDRIDRVAALLARLGVRHLRTMLSWADWCRPDGPEWIDRIVDGTASLDVLPVLHSTPPSFGEHPFTSSVPRRLDYYAYYVGWVCDRYARRFTHVQLWNEQTTWGDWDRTADPWWKRFAAMIRLGAAAARERGVRVVLGGISPPDAHLLDGAVPDVPHFLDIMEAEGALENVDVIAFHGFPGTPQWSHGWGGWDAEIAGISRWAQTRGMATWITETGSSRLMPASRSAELREVVDAALRARIERVYWYSVEDVTWTAQREINLDWGPDPHDYATGLTSDVEAAIRLLVSQPFRSGGAR